MDQKDKKDVITKQSDNHLLKNTITSTHIKTERSFEERVKKGVVKNKKSAEIVDRFEIDVDMLNTLVQSTTYQSNICKSNIC